MRFTFLSMIIVLFSFNAIANIQDSYNRAKQYQNSIKLGNPNPMGNKVIFDKDADISNLSNMSDQDLSYKGGQVLNNSLENQLLQQGELRKIYASQEYDLNAKNPLISNSAKIEADPLRHIEGTALNVSEKVIKTKTSKSCYEGVEFEIDIIRNLILDAELIDQWGDWQDRSMLISPSDIDAALSKQLVKEVYYDKNNWSRATYKAVREEDPLVQIQCKKLIAERLNLAINSIDNYITTGYDEKPLHICYFSTVPEIARLNYRYRDRTKEFKERGEYFQVVNEQIAALLEENECHEIKRTCLESSNKLFFNQYNVNRPCWREQIKYQCSSEPKDGCNYLKQQGCELTSSNCVKQSASICVQWSRNYSCYIEKKELSSSLAGAKMFCLGGDCYTPTIQQNNDMESIAYLAALNAMQKDMQTNPISVFNGHASSCSKTNIGNFLNCCSGFKGWGRDLGLSRCNAEEKALSLKRAKGQCHYVGTCCAEKDPIFKKCITKKSTYCCFNSKLAKVFQEQGRWQLGISFGSSKNANCRGLTVEELQRIDFTKLDLGELFTDLIDQARSKMHQSFPEQLRNQMPKMQQKMPVNSNERNPGLSY